MVQGAAWNKTAADRMKQYSPDVCDTLDMLLRETAAEFFPNEAVAHAELGKWSRALPGCTIWHDFIDTLSAPPPLPPPPPTLYYLNARSAAATDA